MEYMSNNFPGSGGCLNTYSLLEQVQVFWKKQCWELGKEKPDSVPWARGTSRPKMGKPTVLLTGAKVVQERVDYSTDKQASNCEGVHYKLISTFQ